MDKTKALIAALAFAAGTGAGTAISQPAKPDVQVVNMRLVREDLDGGYLWSARVCGYETVKGQRVGDPCWVTNLSSALVAPIEQATLGDKP